MNKTLEQILLDWIGEDDTELKSVSLGPIDIPDIAAQSYNQSLADLRAKVPELVEKITGKFTDVLASSIGANVMGLHHNKTIQDVLKDIIDSLNSE